MSYKKLRNWFDVLAAVCGVVVVKRLHSISFDNFANAEKGKKRSTYTNIAWDTEKKMIICCYFTFKFRGQETLNFSHLLTRVRIMGNKPVSITGWQEHYF